MLTQKHKVNGEETVYISATALRVENQNVGYVVIADSNAGTICFFSDKRKLFFKAPLAGFTYQQQRLLAELINQDLRSLKWKPAGFAAVNGMHASRFQSRDDHIAFGGSRTGGGYLAGQKRSVHVYISLFVTKDIRVPAALRKLLCELQGTPDLGGLPIKQVNVYSDSGDVKVVLDTKAPRRISVAKAMWQVPAGYRETKKLGDITSLDPSGVEELLGE